MLAPNDRQLYIAPRYQHLEKLLLDLESVFSAGDDVLYAKRNLIKKVRLGACETVIKSFKPPSGLRALIYGNVRKSKAFRSFENALRLQRSGITTPEPIAVIEHTNHFRLRESFYITAHYDHHYTMEPVLRSVASAGSVNPCPAYAKNLEILKQFVTFTFRLHEADAIHGDHNPNNTLIRDHGDRADFAVIDLNRMRFGAPTLRKRMTDFTRLSDNDKVLKIIAESYAQLAGYKQETCYALLTRATERRLRIQRWKKTMKQKLLAR